MKIHVTPIRFCWVSKGECGVERALSNSNKQEVLTARDLGIRVQLEVGVQDGIADLVADLIWKQRRRENLGEGKGALASGTGSDWGGWGVAVGGSRRDARDVIGGSG